MNTPAKGTTNIPFWKSKLFFGSLRRSNILHTYRIDGKSLRFTCRRFHAGYGHNTSTTTTFEAHKLCSSQPKMTSKKCVQWGFNRHCCRINWSDYQRRIQKNYNKQIIPVLIDRYECKILLLHSFRLTVNTISIFRKIVLRFSNSPVRRREWQ